MALTLDEIARRMEIAVSVEYLDALPALESEFVEVNTATLPYQPHDISGGAFEINDEIKIVYGPEDIGFV